MNPAFLFGVVVGFALACVLFLISAGLYARDRRNKIEERESLRRAYNRVKG